MKVVIQRVSRASVTVENETVGKVGKGLVLFLGVQDKDTDQDIRWMVEKCLQLRIFENANGKFHYSVTDVNGELLVISQFTLFGDCKKGRRPGFTQAALPDHAEKCYNKFVEILKQSGLNVETGQFAAKMLVEIHNQGPVTLIVDSRES
jgi:D-tyrosyl-tRNA(Tyr) deacylase